MLSDRCLSVLAVCPVMPCSDCDVGVLWPNGWMDQDETWRAGRTRLWPHCITWRPSSPSPKGAHSPQFSDHICCGQMAGWIKMPLGMEVRFSRGDFALDGDTVPPSQKKAGAQPSIFGSCLSWPNSWMDQDATWYKGSEVK